jgi:hypothetical protein
MGARPEPSAGAQLFGAQKPSFFTDIITLQLECDQPPRQLPASVQRLDPDHELTLGLARGTDVRSSKPTPPGQLGYRT